MATDGTLIEVPAQLRDTFVNPVQALPANEQAETEASNRDILVHEGISCDGRLCTAQKASLEGPRYKCVECANIDLCRRCVRDTLNGHDLGHVLLECLQPTTFVKRDKMQGDRPGDSRVTLSALLERAYVFQITDPRDKVYALLGLGPRWAQQVITVDYNSELSAVYKQTTRAILEQDHALAPWSRAGLSYQRQQDLPSWVADWSSFFPHCQYSSETLGIPDRASGDSQVDVQWPFADDDSNLQTKSYKVATISQVGQKVIEKRAYSDQTFAPHELVAEAAHVLVMRTSLPLGETDTLDAFLRIWIGDHTGIIPTIPAPKSALEASNTLLLDQMLAANNEDVAAVAGDNFCLREMLLLYLETAQRPKSEVYTTPLPYAALIANRRFFITAEGYFGLGPLSTLPGDDVHIVSGGKTPYIIRPLEAPDGHALGGAGVSWV